jgi:rod shape-determining protein MreB
MRESFRSRWRSLIADPDLALDLGTANTRLYARGRGLIVDEPSLIKVSLETGAVEAVGACAARPGAGPGKLRSPLRAGVIEDLDAAASLLRPLFGRGARFGLCRPRALACIPTDASNDEREALIEATRRAGASSVVLVPEPMAAAIGSGIDISSPYAHMLVDIGDGVTDIAVIREGELVMTAALRVACSDLHAAISRVASEHYRVGLDWAEADRLTRLIGVARRKVHAENVFASGIDLESGRRRYLHINRRQLMAAIDPVAATIVDAVRKAVRELTPQTAVEVIESGICLTGGGAYLRGMAELLRTETAIDVKPSKDPLRAVINGAREMLRVGAATDLWAS